MEIRYQLTIVKNEKYTYSINRLYTVPCMVVLLLCGMGSTLHTCRVSGTISPRTVLMVGVKWGVGWGYIGSNKNEKRNKKARNK